MKLDYDDNEDDDEGHCTGRVKVEPSVRPALLGRKKSELSATVHSCRVNSGTDWAGRQQQWQREEQASEGNHIIWQSETRFAVVIALRNWPAFPFVHSFIHLPLARALSFAITSRQLLLCLLCVCWLTKCEKSRREREKRSKRRHRRRSCYCCWLMPDRFQLTVDKFDRMRIFPSLALSFLLSLGRHRTEQQQRCWWQIKPPLGHQATTITITTTTSATTNAVADVAIKSLSVKLSFSYFSFLPISLFSVLADFLLLLFLLLLMSPSSKQWYC